MDSTVSDVMGPFDASTLTVRSISPPHDFGMVDVELVTHRRTGLHLCFE